MPVYPSQPPDEPWRDTDGTPIRLHCWVEQIAVDSDHGALPCRLHQHGEVIGRSNGLVYIIFDRDYLITLPPHLVHVLQAQSGC
ncbi:MAG: hypothetical protein JO272_08980 [Pseudonocardiales bacterium]|nr:hypothetical protein [Pseudonocardiales bacterium]